MFCPQCGKEYGPEVTACPNCGKALVPDRPTGGVDEPEWADLVTLLEISDESQILVAKSLLEAEGIRCTLEGEGIQELSGVGRSGAPVRVRVRTEDAEAARELLAAADLTYTGPDEEPEGGEGPA